MIRRLFVTLLVAILLLYMYSLLQKKLDPPKKTDFGTLDFDTFLTIQNGKNPLWDEL